MDSDTTSPAEQGLTDILTFYDIVEHDGPGLVDVIHQEFTLPIQD